MLLTRSRIAGAVQDDQGGDERCRIPFLATLSLRMTPPQPSGRRNMPCSNVPP
jgi:hypothetical protein